MKRERKNHAKYIDVFMMYLHTTTSLIFQTGKCVEIQGQRHAVISPLPLSVSCPALKGATVACASDGRKLTQQQSAWSCCERISHHSA
jgi:hypothetical protein